jgi:rsbT co-antagonist protein RsbR
MSRDEIFAEATSVYDSYVEALETRTLEALQAYAQKLSERIIPRGVETNEVVGIVLLLRDVLARSLFRSTGDAGDARATCSTPTSRPRTRLPSPSPWVRARARAGDPRTAGTLRELSTPVLEHASGC